jgi:hypothetical protein
MRRKILSVLLTVAMLMTMTAFGAMSVSADPADGLQAVGSTTESMQVGGTLVLAVDIVPDSADGDYYVEWTYTSVPAGIVGDAAGDGFEFYIHEVTAQGTITVTAQLMDDDDETVGDPVTFTITVTAAGGNDNGGGTTPVQGLTWNPVTEAFTVANDGTVLYAIVRGTTPELIARARWFPLYGELNLSRMIRRGVRNVYVAFRNTEGALAGVVMAGAEPRIPSIQSGAADIIVTISGRGTDVPQRNAVYWNAAGVGTLNGVNAGTWAVMVGRAGTNGWTALNPATVSQAQFPMGAAIEARQLSGTAALVAVTGNTTITPAGNSARVRIPAVPRAPGAPRVRNGVVTVPAAQQFTWLPNVAALATFDMTTATWTAGADITLTATHTNQVLVTRLAPVSADAGRHRPASFPRATLITEAMVPTAPAAP